MSTRIKFCIVGIPDHQGVMALGGRLGSARGPEAFRKFFGKLKGRIPVVEMTEDAGDVTGIGFDVAVNHTKASEFVFRKTLNREKSVVVGGSHDHGYSHLDGIFKKLEKSS